MITVERPDIPFNSVKYELVDGDVVRFVAGKCVPWPIQELAAQRALEILNKDLSHGGRWRVVWCETVKSKYDKDVKLFFQFVPTIMEIHWLDKDGDPQFKVECEEDGAYIEQYINDYIKVCEEAWQKWYDFIFKGVQVTADQMVKGALGEQFRDGFQTGIIL